MMATRKWLACCLPLLLLAFTMPLQATAEESVSLGWVLHQVETKAPQLFVAQEQVNAASAGVAIAKSKYLGHAEVFARDTHYNNARLVNPISPPIDFAAFATDKNQYGYGASLSLPIDINGQIAASVHAQQYLREAADYQLENTRLRLFADVVALYRGLQRIAGLKQALLQQIKALRKHAGITKEGIRVGRVAPVELLRIDAEVKLVEGKIAALIGDALRNRAFLASLLNKKTFLTPIQEIVVKPSQQAVSGDNQHDLNMRPDIKGASRLRQAQDEQLNSAKRAWLPSFAVEAITSRNQGYTAAGANTWSITGQLTWQFWDGKQRTARIDQARARREQAQQQQLITVNQAQAKLTAAQAMWHAASLQYDAAQAGLKVALETEKIQSSRYHNGRVSVVELLDAEAVLSEARANASQSLTSWWLADDQLYLATGEDPTAYQEYNTEHRVGS